MAAAQQHDVADTSLQRYAGWVGTQDSEAQGESPHVLLGGAQGAEGQSLWQRTGRFQHAVGAAYFFREAVARNTAQAATHQGAGQSSARIAHPCDGMF